METTEQIGLIQALRRVQRRVLQCQDKETIIQDLMEVLSVAAAVGPCIDARLKNASYKLGARERAIRLVKGDIVCIETGAYYDWETVHFQVASSLAMLMMTYCTGGVSRCLEIAP
jgi:hypothetical protein